MKGLKVLLVLIVTMLSGCATTNSGVERYKEQSAAYLEAEKQIAEYLAEMGEMGYYTFETTKGLYLYNNLTGGVKPLNNVNAIAISHWPALSYYSMGRYDDALSAVNAAISLQVKTATKETEAATGFGIRGLIYRAKGNSDEAMKDAEKAMSLDPDNVWARLSYGTACLDKGPYDEGVKALEFEAQGRFRKALKELAGLLSLVTDDGEIKTVVPVKTGIKIDPSTRKPLTKSITKEIYTPFPALNAQWLIAKAMLYAKQGKMKEAMGSYLEISEEDISPENVPAWNDRKVLLQTLKPIAKPIAQTHRENAKKFEAQGRFQEALDELAGALGLAVDDKEAGEVRKSIFQMVRRMPQPPEMSEDARKYALRGEILIKEGEREGAISEIKKAIRLAPFSARLYFNTALIYGEIKNYPEATAYMKIYLEAAPDAPNARAAKDEIIKWELLMERGT